MINSHQPTNIIQNNYGACTIGIYSQRVATNIQRITEERHIMQSDHNPGIRGIIGRGIHPVAAINDIGPSLTFQPVIASPAAQGIIALAAFQNVIARAAIQGIIALIAIQIVIT